MRSFTDQLGRTIYLPSYPERIISVVPSQTELLFDLGLDDEVVGITKFCVHPHHWFHTKARVGGTKTLKMDTINSLTPDLIIASKEENTREQIETLAKNYPVWISDVTDLETALQMIRAIGELTNKAHKATVMVAQIREDFNQLKTAVELRTVENKNRKELLNAAYLIWKDPYLAVGGGTFIHAMLEASGLKNIYRHLTRYPEIQLANLEKLNCELLLLSTEPYPFAQKHVEELQKNLPGMKIMLVDGEMFSWYGSRLIHSAEYFKKILFV
jgi:ABC-type Fe3+-hydroxamate transport system substrate-binding protein